MSRPGRNDPCPCGSGKKYKRCHLGLDARNGVSKPPARSETAAFAGPASIKNALNLLRDVAAQGWDKEEIGKIVSQSEPVLDYLERREEIDGASKELEAHRPDWAVKDLDGITVKDLCKL